MENLLFFLATTFVLRLTSSRKLKNNQIEDTGCFALQFSNTLDFETAVTPSGDRLYIKEFSEKDITYGIICIQLIEEYVIWDAEELLGRYMSKLRKSFRIKHHIGVQTDTDWNNFSSRALVDYWQDGYGKDWKVKGYTNGTVMAILYVKNITQLEVTKQDMFLDSFIFKATA